LSVGGRQTARSEDDRPVVRQAVGEDAVGQPLAVKDALSIPHVSPRDALYDTRVIACEVVARQS
jgi:hypothetical protein